MGFSTFGDRRGDWLRIKTFSLFTRKLIHDIDIIRVYDREHNEYYATLNFFGRLLVNWVKH